MSPRGSAAYGARLGAGVEAVTAPTTLIGLLRLILVELRRRAPAALAASAEALGETRVALRGDGGEHLFIRVQGGGLVPVQRMTRPHVTLKLEGAAVDALLRLDRDAMAVPDLGPLDVTGAPAHIFAAWRCFQVISMRAAGLRRIQQLWIGFREGKGDPAPATPRRPATARTVPTPTVSTGRQILWDGRAGRPWWRRPRPLDADLLERMASYRDTVHREVMALIPDREPRAALYNLLRDYPMRGGKLLRPILLITSCRALGGTTRQALRLAAALELFQNGFLIHDDVEDGSDMRRGKPCLHQTAGLGLAINAGDAMNLLALEAVLGSVERLGLVSTLKVMDEVIRMCRETVEGQAVELGWIRDGVFPREDDAYLEMVTKKTAWYTTIAPCRLGAIAAGQSAPEALGALFNVFRLVGIAFQIQDDLLNLLSDEGAFGKESLGDLLEGKRTLITTDYLRRAGPAARRRAEAWLRKPRKEKRVAEAAALFDTLSAAGAVNYAMRRAATIAAEAAERFESDLAFIPESEDKATLRQVVHYVALREI